jgi:xanthine dehydrogenase YagS FAD-binding subunit
MKEFKLAQPQSLKQVASLPSDGQYYLMAGGTDLLDEIKNGIIEPVVVVDLKSIPDLAYIQKRNGKVHIGAMTHVSKLAEDPTIKTSYHGLHEAANSLATPQLRNVGTVGGNLCQRPRCWYYRDAQVDCRKKGGSRCFATRGRNRYHAILGGDICHIVYPSDLAPAFISMDAEVTIASPNGEKTVLLEDFYSLPRVDVKKENILKTNEILKEIKIPQPKTGTKSTYIKFKERGTWDFALVSAAVSGIVSGKTFVGIKIVLGGVAPIPWRLKKAEDLIKGKAVTENLVNQAAKEALSDARPLEENAYKQELATVAISRAVLSLV